MTTYKTPGVYVEEISTLPPSVAEVSTAIPAFIGCTANGPSPENNKVVPIVRKISTMLEYETIFEKADYSNFAVTASSNNDHPTITSISRKTSTFDFLLYYELSLYFKNGGGSCYIISIGNYNSKPIKAQFEAGLSALEKEDEPTLILLTEAVNLGKTDYYDLCQQALAQCDKLGDRFAILDVLNTGDYIGDFRDKIGNKNLAYGAAYYPYLQTSLTYIYDESTVSVTLEPDEGADIVFTKDFGENGVKVQYNGSATDTPAVKITTGDGTEVNFSVSAENVLTITNITDKTGADIETAWTTWKEASNNTQDFEVLLNGDGSEAVIETSDNVLLEKPQQESKTLADLQSEDTALYNLIKTALTEQRVTLPPSTAVAGVYASTDRDRGVWKAPANVSLSAVTGPVIKITNDEQGNLNVDPNSGKSINAIRAFTGKGTLVWGARTLAGNDNEWRYVSVRRLFNLIEESTQKATSFAVFEPNDASTWLKVKAMIESYLYGLWQQGALAGPTSEAAYFVNVGLGTSMTQQDVLEGRMIVEIGVAPVRPAEFIILRFTHKMQQA